ncbi:hypothetical protein GGR56DRAFT_218160 [Xylariaceae sp. FL0804]|nr:hypothetical protein GGR56DRAFT_218160 [Xylariaceae sp. FL0804]
MARPRKRKHAGSAKHRLSDGPPSKRARIEPDAAPAPAAAQTQHAVLNQYYSRVLTLRDYVVSSLPPSSRIRRKKIAAVGTGARRPSVSSPDVARSLGALLDTTLIGVPALARGRDDAGLDAWKDFSQKQRGDESTVTLSNGIDGFVESQALVSSDFCHLPVVEGDSILVCYDTGPLQLIRYRLSTMSSRHCSLGKNPPCGQNISYVMAIVAMVAWASVPSGQTLMSKLCKDVPGHTC